MKTRSGFVSIVGRPNVGKSTLLNFLVGEKLAGVSKKPQTTREVIRGILTKPKGQIVFLDTPGLHQPQDLLGDWMVHEVEKTIQDSDVIYWMTIPVMPTGAEKKVAAQLQGSKAVILIINQIDKWPKPAILPVIEHYSKVFDFREIIPVSAKTGDQVELLLEKTFKLLPEGPPLFPEDQISDQNERFLVAEILREKLYLLTEQEIPYAAAVMIESFQERPNGIVDIQATIVVERDSQKAIVIGKRGTMMKAIGQAGRVEMERFLGKKVFLQCWVKVFPNWKKDKTMLERLGYG